jgi:phosphatidylglycerol:prolipoprotein diacylglycerol transferase
VLPYINLPEISLGPLPIHWFGILVAVGVLFGIYLARRRAKFMGVDANQLESFINWLLLGGFAGAHILDEIFYHPDDIAARPWSLLYFWEGISSFGGFVGASIGVFLWKKYRYAGKPILPFCDLILSVFPFAWIFGRLGCASVHDHKGRAAAASLFTVAFPDGPHYDLGLLEMLYTVVIALVVASFWGKKRAPGFYVGITAALYAPVRFFLDFLRLESGPTGDRRYLDLTFAQWLCVATLGFGAYMLLRASRAARSSPA